MKLKKVTIDRFDQWSTILRYSGIQLNNRKKEEEKKAAAVTTKTSALNVMAIMEQVAKYRRDKIRPQSESENDDESSRWDDSE